MTCRRPASTRLVPRQPGDAPRKKQFWKSGVQSMRCVSVQAVDSSLAPAYSRQLLVLRFARREDCDRPSDADDSEPGDRPSAAYQGHQAGRDYWHQAAAQRRAKPTAHADPAIAPPCIGELLGIEAGNDANG